MPGLRLKLLVLAVGGGLMVSGGCSQAKSVPRTAEEAYAACARAYQMSFLSSFNIEGVSTADARKRLAALFSCLRRPAEMGHAFSQFSYGLILENGLGVERDVPAAAGLSSRNEPSEDSSEPLRDQRRLTMAKLAGW